MCLCVWCTYWSTGVCCTVVARTYYTSTLFFRKQRWCRARVDLCCSENIWSCTRASDQGTTTVSSRLLLLLECAQNCHLNRPVLSELPCVGACVVCVCLEGLDTYTLIRPHFCALVQIILRQRDAVIRVSIISHMV